MVMVVVDVDHMRAVVIVAAIVAAIMAAIMAAIVVRGVTSVAMVVVSAVVMAVAVMMRVVGWTFVLGHVSHDGLGELPRMVAWTYHGHIWHSKRVDGRKAQFDKV